MIVWLIRKGIAGQWMQNWTHLAFPLVEKAILLLNRDKVQVTSLPVRDKRYHVVSTGIVRATIQ